MTLLRGNADVLSDVSGVTMFSHAKKFGLIFRLPTLSKHFCSILGTHCCDDKIHSIVIIVHCVRTASISSVASEIGPSLRSATNAATSGTIAFEKPVRGGGRSAFGHIARRTNWFFLSFVDAHN
jgi:hypothetical protein